MDDLKLIKKHYGEEMMHFCRDNFATILEEEGKLISLLEKSFAHYKFILAEMRADSEKIEFKDYIYSLLSEEDKELVRTDKDPFTLMAEAGYDLYECKSEEDIQEFKKYYAENEELCTFMGGRLDKCYVFFAVKKDVDKIKREDFTKPKREDLYGTSVISIQFTKGYSNYLSIKNRYNHTVENPDATFGNNLENIIPGLTDAFEKMYNFSISFNEDEFYPDEFVLASDKRFYYFNYEINNIHYCANNYIVDTGKLITTYTDKSRYLLIDYFIIDLKEKRSFLYDERIEDNFVKSIETFSRINIEKMSDTNLKKIDIYTDVDHICIYIDNKYGCIQKLICDNIKYIPNKYLSDISYIEEIDMPSVISVANNFLSASFEIRKINFPKVQTIGDDFINVFSEIKVINMPELISVGRNFMGHTYNLEMIHLPNLTIIGDDFQLYNGLIKISLPSVQKVGNDFLSNSINLEELDMPNLEEIGDHFLRYNRVSNLKIKIPNVKRIGSGFLYNTLSLNNINFPNLEYVRTDFMYSCQKCKKINLPKLKYAGHRFLAHLQKADIQKIVFPSLEEVGDSFLHMLSISEIELPNLEVIGEWGMTINHKLKKIYLPKTKKIGQGFLYDNRELIEINLPLITSLEDSCFATIKQDNISIHIPLLQKYGDFVFNENEKARNTLKNICEKNKQLVKKKGEVNG